ncbi:hypothetical protein SH528x_002189 [Novipirellula sp. SH528]|uniref:hypothetical protein n=1 Tax=Novipirellula sp. SH528 TaxID=3454466 RepID=UPI003F9FFE07
MNITKAIKDKNLLQPFFGDVQTWRPWLTALRAVYGLPVRATASRRLVQYATGRSADSLPEDGFSTALFLTGRRSGKSRIAATIAAYEAVLAGHAAKLSKGEKGVVPVVAPTKAQGRIVRDYTRAIFELPLFRTALVREADGGFELRGGVRIEIMAGDFRTVRGYTLLAAIVDEACFFGYEADAKMNDTELVRALKPSLATVDGKLICISSPYARKGWCYQQHKRHHGNETAKTLVWNVPSRTMNPTLPQRIVDEAMAEDMQAAKSEYLAEFRDDVADYIPREVVEAVVARGMPQRMPRPYIDYVGFADLSGGRLDDAALAIAHRDGRRVVVDYARRWRPPFAPDRVIAEMAEELKGYNVRAVTGDNYAAEFVAGAFTNNDIRYERADKPKSILYAELLPRLCSQEIELPDCEIMVDQLASLERRTRAGGRDVIDHPPGGHDDLANAVAGVATVAATPARRVGAMFC